MIKWILIIFIVLFSVRAIASAPAIGSLDYILLSPPKTDDATNLYQYLNTLYNRWNQLQVTTQEPNVNLNANYGNIVVYYDGTNYWLAVETTAPNGTTWVGTKLGSV